MTRRASSAAAPLLAGTEAALRRAARRARWVAWSTGTLLVTWQDGKIVKERVESCPEDAPGPPFTGKVTGCQ